MLDLRIGMLGAGRMATALAQGFLQGKLTTPDKLLASDPFVSAREQFAAETGAATTADNAEVLASADLLFLAVKPQHVGGVLAELHGKFTTKHLLISIAAGIRMEQLASASQPARLVRVMPNTPALVGQGASAYCLGATARPEDGELVAKLLGAVGLAFCVDEGMLDAVTGLSGSGPAFVYLMIEALSDGGVRMGLPRTVATQLAAQTVAGAARMVLEEGEHPGVLKDRVASPGGTTIAGLEVLERSAVRGALMGAVVAATNRSRELSRGG